MKLLVIDPITDATETATECTVQPLDGTDAPFPVTDPKLIRALFIHPSATSYGEGSYTVDVADDLGLNAAGVPCHSYGLAYSLPRRIMLGCRVRATDRSTRQPYEISSVSATMAHVVDTPSGKGGWVYLANLVFSAEAQQQIAAFAANPYCGSWMTVNQG